MRNAQLPLIQSMSLRVKFARGDIELCEDHPELMTEWEVSFVGWLGTLSDVQLEKLSTKNFSNLQSIALEVKKKVFRQQMTEGKRRLYDAIGSGLINANAK